MSETRKLTTILAADVAGYSRLTAADEERTLARLRALRSDLVDPAISVHHGRVVKRTGDGLLVEFRSPVEAVRCAIEVQDGMGERNAGLPPERRIEFRVGIHVGDVVEEEDGDLMGDAVNIAARIEGIAEQGGIYLSRVAHDQVDGKITDRFTDLGDKELKNIPKPVRVFALVRHGITSLGAADGRSTPPRLSIVVLPFANIGSDPEHEYLVDGVTESLTTDLSRIAGSFVIARNTAFTYKGKPVDVKQIGRDLNVRYVLEGSVQKGGNRLRVNVQLIDAETGNHLWAERFDKPVADLLDMQDEIVARLARQLDTELIAAEARRAEHTPDADSMDLYYRGMALVNKGGTSVYLAEGPDLFDRALALDPKNVQAIVGAASIQLSLGSSVLADDPEKRYAAAETGLLKALSLAPNHATAHRLLGHVFIQTNRAERGIAECEHALRLDRNQASAHAIMGLAKITLGRFEETEAHVIEALRLSPRDSAAYQWAHIVGLSKLTLERDEEAIVWYRRSIELNRNFFLSRSIIASALALSGKLDEARAEATVALGINPKVTISLMRHVIRTATNNPVVLAQAERMGNGLRIAGIPEGEPEKAAGPRLSIVVLPFTNIGGDPEQEYFVDGVTESLTTDLSRIAGSFVIARNTAFTYKGKPVDVKQIGHELNVRYVLEGSVQRGGNRLRVNVQLIDAESGAHLWAERFDKPLADLFDMQDEIVARLARALGVQLAIAEAYRSDHEGRNPDSLDLSMRGWSIFHKDYTPQGAAEAAPLFEQAAKLDPANVEALIGLSWTHSLIAVNAGDEMSSHVATASDAASRATAIAPRDPRAHLVRCRATGARTA